MSKHIASIVNLMVDMDESKQQKLYEIALKISSDTDNVHTDESVVDNTETRSVKIQGIISRIMSRNFCIQERHGQIAFCYYRNMSLANSENHSINVANTSSFSIEDRRNALLSAFNLSEDHSTACIASLYGDRIACTYEDLEDLIILSKL